MTEEDQFISLEKRVSVIEARLGIDPAAVLADEAASLATGAEAHVGNAQSDVEPPVVAESVESALAAAETAGTPQDALDHVNRALQTWPEDADLLAAKADLETIVAAAAEPAPPEQS